MQLYYKLSYTIQALILIVQYYMHAAVFSCINLDILHKGIKAYEYLEP